MSTTSAARAPTPPTRGTGSRNPNIARLGMVWTMLAIAISGAARRGRRAANTPSGTPSPTAASVDAATSTTCWPSRLPSSAPCDNQNNSNRVIRGVSTQGTQRRPRTQRTRESASKRVGRPFQGRRSARLKASPYGLEPGSRTQRSSPGYRDNSVQQPPDARIGGHGDRRRRIAGNEPAVLEDADAVCERERFAHVVCDDDDGLPQALLDLSELGVQLGAREGIERAEGLVHQQDRRIGRDRAGDPDPL